MDLKNCLICLFCGLQVYKFNHIIDYIHDHLRQEVDFINEGKNAEKAHEFIKQNSSLKKIYIPKVN